MTFQERAIVFTLSTISRLAPKVTGKYAARLFMTPRRHPRPFWEEELILSSTPIEFPENIRGWSWGQGPTILLVHGWEGRGTQLGKFIQPLVDNGFRVVAFDGPAHGRSPGSRTNLADFAHAICDVAGQVGDLYAMIGHSFGAGAAMLSLEMGVKIDRIALIASPCGLQGVFDRFCEMVHFAPPAAKEFQARVEEIAGFEARKMHVGELGKTHCPHAVVIHDIDDKDVPFADAEEIVRHWPAARLIAVRGLGHRRILKAKETVRSVTEFFSRDFEQRRKIDTPNF